MSDVKMGKQNSKIYVAKESFKSTNETPGYISFEVRPYSSLVKKCANRPQ